MVWYLADIMKKIILFIVLLLSITLAEAALASLNVSWQLSSNLLRPSSTATASLTISNSGSVELTNVIIKASGGPYVKVISGNNIELGSMSTLISTQAYISIKIDDNAISTNSYIYLEVDYYYTDTSFYKKILYIPVTILREPILQIRNVNFSSSPEPGKTVHLTFDLKNEGSGNAKDIIVYIESNSNFIVPESSGEFFIEKLDGSESRSITIPIAVSPEVSIGTSSIPIKLTYYDETRSNNYTQSKEIGLKISGNVDFIVTVNSYENFYYGRTGIASIYIANRGLSSANFISVEASSDFGSKEFYIGNLDSDDSDTIELPQDLSKASGKYPIKLTLNYRDEFENVYSVEKFVEVTPANAPIDYNIIIIAAAVVVVVYWFLRKRKK
jgi:hypothetical protein